MGEKSFLRFLSTPSARRATSSRLPHTSCRGDFYPRPPRGGRRGNFITPPARFRFLSTPSARRATPLDYKTGRSSGISIHALREEGDARAAAAVAIFFISIHALREEGDPSGAVHRPGHCDFYPRPPRGGRLGRIWTASFTTRFLSTPSARRATYSLFSYLLSLWDFYPRPPRGGRPGTVRRIYHACYFYPRPPRGGRQQKQRQNLYFQTNYTTFCTNLEEP